MKLKFITSWSPDVEVDDLSQWRPPDPDDVSVELEVLAGPDGDIGEEKFSLEVSTPRAIARLVERDGVVALLHHIVLARWDWPTLWGFLETYASKCEGDTWEEVATRFGLMARWEFDESPSISASAQTTHSWCGSLAGRLGKASPT